MSFVNHPNNNNAEGSDTNSNGILPVTPVGNGFELFCNHIETNLANSSMENLTNNQRHDRTRPNISENMIYSKMFTIHPHNLVSYLKDNLLFTYGQIVEVCCELIYILEDHIENVNTIHIFNEDQPLTNHIVENLYNDYVYELQNISRQRQATVSIAFLTRDYQRFIINIERRNSMRNNNNNRNNNEDVERSVSQSNETISSSPSQTRQNNVQQNTQPELTTHRQTINQAMNVLNQYYIHRQNNINGWGGSE